MNGLEPIVCFTTEHVQMQTGLGYILAAAMLLCFLLVIPTDYPEDERND